MKGTKYGKELLISVEVAGGFGNWYGVGTVVHGGRHLCDTGREVERWSGGESKSREVGATKLVRACYFRPLI